MQVTSLPSSAAAAVDPGDLSARASALATHAFTQVMGILSAPAIGLEPITYRLTEIL